jgi:hypothetical protein
MFYLRTAKRAFAVPALDEAVLKRIHDDWSAEDYDGMLLFLDEWADALTFDSAKKIIEDFDLAEELGDPATVQDRYEHVDEVFYDIEDALNRGDVKAINDESSIAKVGGPEYSAGRDGLKFGLLFHASSADLEDLRERFPQADDDTQDAAQKSDEEQLAEEIQEAEEEVKESEKSAYTRMASSDVSRCVQQAINLVQGVDFGYTGDDAIEGLEKANNLLESCGVINKNLRLAIRHFITDRDKSHEYIYGTDSKSNEGALKELQLTVTLPVETTQQKDLSMRTSRFVTFRGALYELVDEAPQQKTAYHLPEKLKGVRTCRSQDIDEKKPAADQVWCVFDSHGNLRARYRDKKKALRYKVFMINRYWSSGKGKTRKDRPTNK